MSDLMPDHRRRAGLSRGGAEPSLYISCADSAGRVVGGGRILDKRMDNDINIILMIKLTFIPF